MKSRILILVIFIMILSTVSVVAFEAKDLDSYGQTPVAISWRESDTIYIALVNSSSSRQSYTLEVYDTQRRTTLIRAEVLVPSRSVLIEALNPRETGKARFPIEEVTIYSGYRSRTIKIQDNPYFTVDNYVVPANSNIKVGVDFIGIRGNNTAGRLEVDPDYRMYVGNRTGSISIDFEGGYSYKYRNTIEYRPPFMELSMRTPSIYGTDLLTFGVTHYPEGTWRSSYLYGPVLLVYGTDYRVINNTNSPLSSTSTNEDSGWVIR